ncbi:unnamed protein product, partial [Mesorhabditis belari]|uniref:DUF7930 domain-containing protein n=1 Tax=Mesorhabditis belari TaxID=2138241 RepID=A0AAF3EKH9_9BILA
MKKNREQPTHINCTGRVNRVDTKYMYVTSFYGSIFCPIATTVAEECPDLKKRYKEGDIVHVRASLQMRKNQCTYCAIKVRLSQNSTCYQGQPLGEEIDDQEIIITNVHETLAYAEHELYGQVFIPGSAFPASQTGRLTTRIFPGDKIKAKIRAQNEKNNCKYLAISAKVIDAKGGEIITGRAQVIEVEQYYAVAWNEQYGRVHCPILTWCGGDLDTDVETLPELLKFGDEILFNGRKSEKDDQFRATRWVRSNQQLGPSNKVITFADSNTQTTPTVIELFVGSIPKNKLDELLEGKPVLKGLVLDSIK